MSVLNVSGRTELLRRVVFVVLLLTAGSANAFAREFRDADTQNEGYPTVQALRFMGRQIADPKGLPIRVRQSGQMSEMMRALGAAPVELPYGQVLTGLATRLIEGEEINRPSFITTDHYKHAGAARSGLGAIDRTHPQGGVSRLWQ